MICPVCTYDYLNKIQCEFCLLPKSHSKYAEDISVGPKLDSINEIYRRLSILDLSGREYICLLKNFIKGLLICAGIYLIPYFIAVQMGLGQILDSMGHRINIEPKWILIGAFGGYFIYCLFEDFEYTFRFLGDCFYAIADYTKEKGRTKAIFFILGNIAFLCFCFYIGTINPLLTFFISVLLLIPLLVTHHKYDCIKKAKALVLSYD